MNKKIFISILCKTPDEIHLEFWKHFLSKYKDRYSIFFICDDNEFIIPPFLQDEYKDINIIQILDKECSDLSYKKSCYATIKNKEVTSWDKCLYYFNHINLDYNYLWILEDDVFVPTIDVIPNIDIKYYDDLLSPQFVINTDGTSSRESRWKNLHVNIMKNFNVSLPWARSMACAIRLSNSFLKIVDQDIQDRKEVLFIECIFSTIALHKNIKQASPSELAFIHWKAKNIGAWSAHDINMKNLYHPVKYAPSQAIYREKINLKKV